MTALLAYSRPPFGEPAHETATYLFTVLMAAFFVGLLVWSVRVARRERTWLPIACLFGGLLSFGFEPVLDSVGHIFYPLGSPLTVVTIFNTTIPAYVVMAYVFWVGAGTYLLMRWLERGRSGAEVMRMFLLWCLIEPLFEYPAVLSEALIYYGHQPFKLAGYPLYWPFGNTGAVFVSAYVLLLAKPHLRGARGFAIAALIPGLTFFAVNAMGSWPVWLTINSQAPIAVIWFGGAVSIALYVAVIRLVGWCLDRGVSLEGATAPPTPGRAPRARHPRSEGTRAVRSS